MQPIADPWEVLTATLAWLGVPTLVLLPFLIALGIAEWLKFGAASLRVSRRVAEMSSAQIRRLVVTRSGALVALTLAQAALIASVYALFRLVYAMGLDDGSGRNIADGKSFAFTELWVNLTAYSGESQLSINAALITLGWVLALNIANFTRSRITVNIVKFPLFVLVPLSIIAAIGLGIVGLMVWSLATWMNSPGYSLGMVWLYVFWVVLLSLVAFTSVESSQRAARAFGRNP